MRVALVATSYPAHEGDPSGHFVRAEAIAFAASGADVHVIAPAPFAGDPKVQAHAAGGASLFAWPGAVARAKQSPLRLLAASAFLRGARAWLARLEPELVVAHWMVPAAFPIAVSLRNLPAGARLEVVCHGADVRLLLAMPGALRAEIVSRVCERASRVRIVSGELLEALCRSLPAAPRAQLERLAEVALPVVETASAGPAPAGQGSYVIASGRLVASKRVDVAIEAMRGADVTLVVLGDGPERARLEQLASRVAPGCVRFLGQIPRDRALAWVRGARALVHTSEAEGAPTVVLEALSLGVPVVACAAGDIARWSSSDARIHLCTRDARAVGSALSLLLSAPHDS